MGLPVYSKLDQTWRMQLQPIEEVSVDEVVVVTVAVDAVEAVVVVVEAAVARRRRSGYLELNLAVSSKRAKSSRLRRFIFSHYPSKSSRLLIISSGQRSRMRCRRSCRSRNRRALVSVPDSKRLSPSVTTMAMLDWASSAVEVATAIRGAIILAKLSIVPVRRGFWGNKIGKPHTVPCKVTGKCGSFWVRLIPAPRGTGIVSAPVPKKLLQMAGIEDCYTSARGSTGTLGNFAKATYAAIAKTYAYLTPDLWKETVFIKSPYQEYSDHLAKSHKPVGVQKQEVKQY